MTQEEFKTKKAELKRLREERQMLEIEGKIEAARRELEIAKMTPEEREAEANRILEEKKAEEGEKQSGFWDDIEKAKDFLESPIPDDYVPYYWLTFLAAIGIFAVILFAG